LEKLGALAVAPVLICLVYMYIRDKYEKEPWRLLVTGVVAGCIITLPVMQGQGFVARFMPIDIGQFGEAVFTSFAIASLVEEGFKFAVLYFLVWHGKNLNEKVDGIVYAVFISLGFAGVENVLYVFNPQLGGLATALLRAVVSVPAHGLFGVIMGYHFAIAKFEPQNKNLRMFLAFFSTWLAHGIYNTILLSGHAYYLVVFVPFLLMLWHGGLKKIKMHLEASPFK
jgi:RsiW-degrading membrane proteinase PrsW (M82 family)